MQVLWWDTRKLKEPVDKFCVDKKQDCKRATGAMCLEYEPTMVSGDVGLYLQCFDARHSTCEKSGCIVKI